MRRTLLKTPEPIAAISVTLPRLVRRTDRTVLSSEKLRLQQHRQLPQLPLDFATHSPPFYSSRTPVPVVRRYQRSFEANLRRTFQTLEDPFPACPLHHQNDSPLPRSMRQLVNLHTLSPLIPTSSFEAIVRALSPIHHRSLLEERTLSLMRSARICCHQPTFVVAALSWSLLLSSPSPSFYSSSRSLPGSSPIFPRCL